MARKPRLHVPGGIYHVLMRGNAGDDIFFDKGDRTRFLLLLQEGTERFSYRLHAFCLMTNHIHLIIQVGEIPLSKIVQNLSFRYTKYINTKMKRVGHLFQGRYKAILIDGDSYLLELVRYIHNNPVRAGLASNAGDYPWSSHTAYLGTSKTPYVTTDFVLAQFGSDLKRARSGYSDFVSKGRWEESREEFYGGQLDNRVLGDDTFVDDILNRKHLFKPPSLDDIVTLVCRKFEIKESTLGKLTRRRDYAEIRGVIGWIASKLQACSLTDIGKRFNRDQATISRAVRRVDKKFDETAEFKERINELIESLESK